MVPKTTLCILVQVNEAVLILHEYNARLCAEMEDRKKLTTMLKDFQTEQRELLAQAEQRLQVNIEWTLCIMKPIKRAIFMIPNVRKWSFWW